jgi:hypothetical protein
VAARADSGVTRASDRERDAVVQRVQDAFAEGRLDDAVTQDGHDEDPGYRLPVDAPVIHVRGVACKGTVEIATRPPDRPLLRR